MGLKQSIMSNFSTFCEEQWQKTTITTYTKIKDPFYGSNFQVFVNRLNNNLQVQKYSLVFNSYREYQAYREIIDWRNSHHYLISSKYIKSISQQTMCTDMHYSSIFIERIPIRLFQIGDIELEQALYILYVSIQAFSYLFQKFGYFSIESDMVCFTKDGYVKVWANKNLSKVYPQNYRKVNKSFSQFIQSLLIMLQGLIDYEGKISISKFIQKKKIKLPFSDLLKVIEYYTRQNHVTIPRYLKSIRSLCKKQKKSALSYRQSYEDILTMKKGSNKTLIYTKMSDTLKTQNFLNESLVYKSSRQRQKINNFLSVDSDNFGHHKKLNISFQSKDANVNDNIRNAKTSIEYHTRKRKLFSDIIVPEARIKRLLSKQSSEMPNFDRYQIDSEIAEDLFKLSQTNI